MITLITLILLILAFICFVIAAAGVALGRVNMIGLGLALWVLTQLIAAFPAR